MNNAEMMITTKINGGSVLEAIGGIDRQLLYQLFHAPISCLPNTMPCTIAGNDILYGSFVSGLLCQKNNQKYYMFVSGDNYHSDPREVAFGMADHDFVYLWKEEFPKRFWADLFCISNRYIGSIVSPQIFTPRHWTGQISQFEPFEKLSDPYLARTAHYAYEALQVFQNVLDYYQQGEGTKVRQISRVSF